MAAEATGTGQLAIAAGLVASGTGAISYQEQATQADGTGYVDDAVASAWLSPGRLTRADVFVGDPEVRLLNLVDAVQIDRKLDDVVPRMTFVLADPKAAVNAVGSIANGEYPVRVAALVGPPGAVEEWEPFRGFIEGSKNDGPYRPRGTFSCGGVLSAALKRTACLRLGAFSGKTDGELVALYAGAAGVPVTGISWGSTLRNRPVEISGVTVPDLILRRGEGQGLRVRERDGAIEVLSEVDVLRSPPIFAFDDSNIIAIGEEAPAAPTTKWNLSGMAIQRDALSEGTRTTRIPTEGFDEDGNKWAILTEITTDQGTEVFRRVTEWRTFKLPGVTPGPLTFQLAKMIETETIYEKAPNPSGGYPLMLYTTKVLSRTTRTFENAGVPVALTTLGNNWDGGGRFESTHAIWMLTSRTTERFTWYDGGESQGIRRCALKAHTKETEGYYSPLKPTGHDYADGKTREHGTWPFQVIQRDVTTYLDQRDQAAIPTLYIVKDHSAFHITGYDTGTAEPIESFVRVENVIEQYSQPPGGQQHTLTTLTTPYIKDGAHLVVARSVEYRSGPIPDTPRGSITTPQYVNSPILLTVGVASNYREREEAEFLEHIETFEDLRAVAFTRLRRAFMRIYPINSRAVPFLQEGDCVSVTSRARNLEEVNAIVLAVSQRYGCDGNGGANQTTTVGVVPQWLLDLEAA